MDTFLRLVAATGVVIATAAPALAQSAPASTAPKVTIYGTVVANGSFADAELNISDIPVWAVVGDAVLTPPAIGGQPPGTVLAADVTNFEMTARQSRVGLRVDVPAGTSNWTPTGQIEIDFFGARPASGQGSVFNQPRIRLALISLAHSSGWTLVAGQDWSVFAPANPTSFAHYAVPMAASGGNPWMRLPQFRVQKSTRTGDNKTMLFQLAAVRPSSGGDSPAAGSLADPVALSGERSGWPFVQARVAFNGAGKAGRPNSVGVSTHFGHERAEPQTLTTWGVALDAAAAPASRMAVTGEVWHGENLDTFQAGIGQGVSLRSGTFYSVKSSGGWGQVSWFATPSVSVNGGYGIDDPDDNALTAAVTRARNQLGWISLMVKPHPAVTVAFEYNRFDTTYRTSAAAAERNGAANYANVAVVLAF
jgi:hypothetical protein